MYIRSRRFAAAPRYIFAVRKYYRSARARARTRINVPIISQVAARPRPRPGARISGTPAEFIRVRQRTPAPFFSPPPHHHHHLPLLPSFVRNERAACSKIRNRARGSGSGSGSSGNGSGNGGGGGGEGSVSIKGQAGFRRYPAFYQKQIAYASYDARSVRVCARARARYLQSAKLMAGYSRVGWRR